MCFVLEEETCGCESMDKKFCNWDWESRGYCENCPYESSDCHNSGLPSQKGIESCERWCFGEGNNKI